MFMDSLEDKVKPRFTVDKLMRKLAAYVGAEEVDEVAVNQPGEVWTKTFSGWTRHDDPAVSKDYLESLTTAVSTFNGMNPGLLNYFTMPDGERCTIARGSSLHEGAYAVALRKHKITVKTLAALDYEGVFDDCLDVSINRPSEEDCNEAVQRAGFDGLEQFESHLLALKREGNIASFLRAAVLAKRNIVIAGKTGSGKTTLARSLIEIVPTSERIITIEDVHELKLPNHPNSLPMLYGTGRGRVSAKDCLAACMRLSPDRIMLAEMRGSEAWDYLNSLNTDHGGGISTVHANDARATFDRLAQLIKASEVGQSLDHQTILHALYSTVHVVIFMRARRVIEVFYDPIFCKSHLLTK
jgi:type IV secretion system protein VirB11